MDEIESFFLQKIKTADMILVGIGSKWTRADKEKDNLQKNFTDLEKKKDFVWIKEFAINICGRKCLDQKVERATNALEQVLNGKNYFIVSLCTDFGIFAGGIRSDRTVMPCGNREKLQCSDRCGARTSAIDPEFEGKIKAYMRGEIRAEDIERPVCGNCGKYLVFNEIENQPYTEGYLDQWEKYTRWLQGTLNRELCVIELDVGIEHPSVIRWPFEKIAYYNKKSTFFRINDRFYHLPEELKESGHSIKRPAIDFLINIFV